MNQNNFYLDDRHKTALIFALGALKGLQSKYPDHELPDGIEDCIIDILDQLGVTLFRRTKEPEGSDEATS